jgi:RNA polymerase sigma-70 factor (ECF subfamily)
MPDQQTEHLLTRYRAGDEAAAQELFHRYAERLAALVRSRLSAALGRRLDAEDVVQSAFRSFFGGVGQDRFTFGRSGDAWRLLVTITLHKLHRQARRHRAGKRDLRQEESPAPKEPGDPLAAALAREPAAAEAVAVAEEFQQCLATLAPRDRRIVELHLQGQADADVAAAAGCAERTVRRVRTDFRAELERRLLAEQEDARE